MPDAAAAKRFRVALSFAGEKREFVAQVARILADRFGDAAILYDKFHEAEFAVFDQGIRLAKLYGEQSDLIVPVLCPAYDAQRWTGWEWVHIYGLLTKTDGHRVMPSRFEYAITDGLSPTAGFIELDHKTPEQFASLILERLAINEGKPKDHYTKPAPTTVSSPRTSIPHNLPALQPFFGREEELERIAEALDPENRTWGVMIEGHGGMGKTSLAVRAAYSVSRDTFDRIAFISLKPRELDDNGVRDLSGFLISGLAELLNELARELGHADIAKAVDDQRPRLLLDALRGTRTLLVLDNLETLTTPERKTVFTFVTRLPQGCKAILTSRGRIGSGAEELILGRLSEDAALATLAKLAERNPALAKTSEAERLTLYRETGGKPLLLRWTAGQIGRGSCVTFTDAISHLRSCPEGNDPLEFVFGDLVEDFSDAETRVLCALTYFTLPAKVEHTAEVVESTEADTDHALRTLINRSLVVPSEELSSFTLVPLVADFMKKKRPEIVAETGDRLEKHATALIVENGYQQHDQFPVLDAAWPTVAAALPRFLQGSNDRLQKVCGALNYFLEFTGRWDEWLSLSQKSESRAVEIGDFESAGWRAYQAGWVQYLRGQSSDVLATADRTEAHWRKAPTGVRERAIAIRLRAHGHGLDEDYQAAIALLKQVADLLRTVNRETSPVQSNPLQSSEDVARALNALASVEQLSGDLDAAKQHYEEALHIGKAVDYQEGVATCTGNLAEVAVDREDWSGAETLAREALSLSEGIGRLELIGSNHLRLAQALVRQGKKAEALPHARRAVDIYGRLGMRNRLADARATLVECER
jgi:tetratricopeptide (TPR) repeat protein